MVERIEGKTRPLCSESGQSCVPSAALFDLLEELENLGRGDLFNRAVGERAGEVFGEPLVFGDGGRRRDTILHPRDVFLGDQAEGGARLRKSRDLPLLAFGGGVDAGDQQSLGIVPPLLCVESDTSGYFPKERIFFLLKVAITQLPEFRAAFFWTRR